MGTERDNLKQPCLCGAGTINVEQESPDHPWGNASQIHYHGTLNCSVCAQTYAVENGWSGTKPYLALKAEVEARDSAKMEYRALEKKFREHDLVKGLEPALIDAIDGALAKSKAAAHRLLVKYGLTHESLAIYRKRTKDGAQAIGAASGHAMARIGKTLGATEADRAAFAKVDQKLDELLDAGHKAPARVKTGHLWLQA